MASDVRALGKSGHYFSNWATTYSCRPELYFEPETTEDIQKILSCARDKGKKVKVVGNGHSPSDLACTTDYMISLCRYNRVLNVNTKKMQVTVQGGCLVRDLNQKVLPSHGLAFSVLGTVSDLTVAGVISTGTHGTGADYGILSTYVVDMDMLTAAGEVIHVSKEDNSGLYPAVVLGLGALGIILSVTLQCQPAFNLHQTQHPATLKDVLENLNVYITSSDHFRFFWFPHTENVICYHASRTKKEPKAKSSWFWDSFMGYHALQLLYWTSTFLPSLVPIINRVYYRLCYAHRSERTDSSYKIFNFNCLFRQYVMEWALPREKTGVALTGLNNWILNNNFPAHFPVEVRFVKQDDVLLSPAYGRETCYINIIMYRPYNKYVPKEEYWDSFASIMASVGARPHWAKDHTYSSKEFEVLYPKWKEFCRLRQQLDPNGMFLNSYLERVFGKSSVPSDLSTAAME